MGCWKRRARERNKLVFVGIRRLVGSVESLCSEGVLANGPRLRLCLRGELELTLNEVFRRFLPRFAGIMVRKLVRPA